MFCIWSRQKIHNGHEHPPHDQPVKAYVQDGPAFAKADAWFLKMYYGFQYLIKPLGSQPAGCPRIHVNLMKMNKYKLISNL